VAPKNPLSSSGFPGDEAGFRQLWRENHGTFLLLFAGLILIVGGILMSLPRTQRRREVVATDESVPSDERETESGELAREIPIVGAVDGATEAPLTELSVTIDGAEEDTGKMRVALFTTAASFNNIADAAAKEELPIERGRARWIVRVPRGETIAIKAYHDKNENRDLDTTIFGVPNEPYGFSRGARAQTGPPKFEQAAFEVVGEQMDVSFEVW
jgi:uncharacterized protein (DUF2141 family)